MRYSADTFPPWQPPSPYDVVYAKELQAIITKKFGSVVFDSFDTYEDRLSVFSVMRIIEAALKILFYDCEPVA